MGDQFKWGLSASGSWGIPGNWIDLTTGSNPAVTSPTSVDTATIAGPTSAFDVIGGPGSAASLLTTGEVALNGSFTTGSLTVGTDATASTLDLFSGSAVTVSGDASVVSGNLQDNGGALSVAGALTLGGTSGATDGALFISNHGSVRVGGLALRPGGSRDPSVTVDGTSILEIGTAGTAAAGTVTVDVGATLSATTAVGISAAAVLNNGVVSGYIDLGGPVTNNGMISHAIVSGGTNNGTIVGSNLGGYGGYTVVNNGTILTGGSAFVTGIIGSGLLGISHNGALSVGTGVTDQITFLDNTGTLFLGMAGRPASTLPIAGFVAGDIIVDNQVFASAATYTSTGANTGNLVLVNNGSNVGTVTLLGNYTGDIFIPTFSGGATYITLAVACFAAGTRIRTERGEVVVEDLRAGDLVNAWFGGVVPVQWIGHRHVDCRAHPKPKTIWPVRVSAGALGDGKPHRDLWLSPDHAVFINDVLIPIKHLINGSTIAQVAVDEVTYYHVELPHHDLLLAEGLPAESYLDTGDRTNFTNCGDVTRLFPDFSTRTPNACAVWEMYACAPLVVTGPKLAAARRRIDSIAATIEESAAREESLYPKDAKRHGPPRDSRRMHRQLTSMKLTPDQMNAKNRRFARLVFPA